jgi:hypothetical protein
VTGDGGLFSTEFKTIRRPTLSGQLCNLEILTYTHERLLWTGTSG